MDVEERIRDVVVRQLGVKPDEVRPKTNLENDLGMDSTEIVEMTVALEKAFGVKIDDGEIRKNQSIGDVISLIESRVS
jgi:acyl carrier protein